MLKCRLKAAFHNKICKVLMPVQIVTFCPIIFHCRFYIYLMHACRLKAGFPTIFEIRSAKSEGGVKYICV